MTCASICATCASRLLRWSSETKRSIALQRFLARTADPGIDSMLVSKVRSSASCTIQSATISSITSGVIEAQISITFGRVAFSNLDLRVFNLSRPLPSTPMSNFIDFPFFQNTYQSCAPIRGASLQHSRLCRSPQCSGARVVGQRNGNYSLRDHPLFKSLISSSTVSSDHLQLAHRRRRATQSPVYQDTASDT